MKNLRSGGLSKYKQVKCHHKMVGQWLLEQRQIWPKVFQQMGKKLYPKVVAFNLVRGVGGEERVGLDV